MQSCVHASNISLVNFYSSQQGGRARSELDTAEVMNGPEVTGGDQDNLLHIAQEKLTVKDLFTFSQQIASGLVSV